MEATRILKALKDVPQDMRQSIKYTNFQNNFTLEQFNKDINIETEYNQGCISIDDYDYVESINFKPLSRSPSTYDLLKVFHSPTPPSNENNNRPNHKKYKISNTKYSKL